MKSEKIHRKVQVWIFRKATNQVLLLKTIPNRGAFWQPVTGGADPGESLLHAAQREAKEETGIDLPPTCFSPADFEFEFEGRHGIAHETVWIATLDHATAVTIDPSEHTDFHWATPDEGIAMVAHDVYKAILTRNFKAQHRLRNLPQSPLHLTGRHSKTKRFVTKLAITIVLLIFLKWLGVWKISS